MPRPGAPPWVKWTIGASMVADICGVQSESVNGRSKSGRSRKWCWEIKTGRKIRPKANKFMKWGEENEANAVMATQCKLGVFWDETGEDWDDQHCFERGFKDDGFEVVMYADGVSSDMTEALEVKCPQQLRDFPQLKYQIQMAVAFSIDPRIERFLYSEWTPGASRMWWCYPNRDMEALMWKYIDVFVEYLKTDEEPPQWSSKANPRPDFTDIQMRCERI